MPKISLTEDDGVLTIEHDRTLPIGVALVFGSQAIFLLVFAINADLPASAVLLAISLLAILLASFAVSARVVYTLDREFRYVERRFRTILVNSKTQYNLDEFERVGIGIGGRGSSQLGAPVTTYFVQIIRADSRGVKISTASGDKDSVKRNAKRIADYLRLPFEEEPKTVWFGKRIG